MTFGFRFIWGLWFDQKWEPKLNSSEWKSTVSTYKHLLTNFGPPNPTSNGFYENRLLFSNGHCGIWVDATTVAAGMLFNPQQSQVHAQVRFAPAPIAVTQKRASWIWTWALAVPESSTNKKEAVQFIT